MTADLSRYDDVLAWLRACGAAEPDLRAIWIGGSAATGGYDDWSDLDVEVLCTPGESVRVHEAMLAAATVPPRGVDLAAAAPAPGPTAASRSSRCTATPARSPSRPGSSTCTSTTTPPRPAASTRAGTDGSSSCTTPTGSSSRPTTTSATWSAVGCSSSTRSSSAATSPAGWSPARTPGQQPAEATALYLRLGLMALVTLLRNEVCPWRFDYGLRYLDTDLPPDQRARVESLLPGAGPLAELFGRLLRLDGRAPRCPAHPRLGAGRPGDRRRRRARDVHPGRRRVVARGVRRLPPGLCPRPSTPACCSSSTPGCLQADAGDWLRTWQDRTRRVGA